MTKKMFVIIKEVVRVTDKAALIIEEGTNKAMWLPLNQSQRYNNRVFIPDWLYERVHQPESEAEDGIEERT